MAHTGTADSPHPPPKPISLEEIETGTSRLREVLAAINDFSQDGKPKLKNAVAPFPPARSNPKPPLTAVPLLRYSGSHMASATVPHTIHAPETELSLMCDRASIMINVQPGQTSSVVKASTQLVLNRLHGIEGVAQTDTHMVYKLAESQP